MDQCSVHSYNLPRLLCRIRKLQNCQLNKQLIVFIAPLGAGIRVQIAIYTIKQTYYCWAEDNAPAEINKFAK